MNQKIAIIGAGMAGVAAGRALQAQGYEITLFEKSRGYGGRCATKRWEGHIVDHGAQYFTLRDERFRAAVEASSGSALQRLSAPVLDESGAPWPDSGRWFHRDGNNRLVRDLAQGLELRTEQTISDATALLQRHGGAYAHVISTAPWTQTAALFGLETTFTYIPCLTVLLAYDGTGLGRAAEAYAISDRSAPLAWSACENHKPGRISPGQTVFVAQLSEAFSRTHLEPPLEAYPELVRPLVEARWELPAAQFRAALGHRWRFARIQSPLILPQLPDDLHFAGDALTASRLEDAWRAGTELAESGRFSQ